MSKTKCELIMLCVISDLWKQKEVNFLEVIGLGLVELCFLLLELLDY